jgi:hypothetical protein
MPTERATDADRRHLACVRALNVAVVRYRRPVSAVGCLLQFRKATRSAARPDGCGKTTVLKMMGGLIRDRRALELRGSRSPGLIPVGVIPATDAYAAAQR